MEIYRRTFDNRLAARLTLSIGRRFVCLIDFSGWMFRNVGVLHIAGSMTGCYFALFVRFLVARHSLSRRSNSFLDTVSECLTASVISPER